MKCMYWYLSVVPHVFIWYSSKRQKFLPLFCKSFDHLETLLTICRPKKVLSAGSLCGRLVPSPQSKCPKKTFVLPKKNHVSVSNMLSKPLKCLMENENWHKFQGPNLGPAKCWFKGFILPHKYHAPNFYQRFWHTLAN